MMPYTVCISLKYLFFCNIVLFTMSITIQSFQSSFKVQHNHLEHIKSNFISDPFLPCVSDSHGFFSKSFSGKLREVPAAVLPLFASRMQRARPIFEVDPAKTISSLTVGFSPQKNGWRSIRNNGGWMGLVYILPTFS